MSVAPPRTAAEPPDVRAIADPADPPIPGIWWQLHRWLRAAKVAVYTATTVFLVVLLAQVAWLYQQAAAIHWLLGGAVLTVFGFLAVTLVGVPLYRFLRTPRVVQPPAIPHGDDLTLEHLVLEARYLDAYLFNLSRNVEIRQKHTEIVLARKEVQALQSRIRAADPSRLQALDRELTDWTRRTMPALLAPLDTRAERLIYQESLAVGIATAVSPNGVLDAFVMLWRSVQLVSRISTLYYGRPGLRGTVAICRDVAVATAMAGYLQNVTESLGGLVAKTIGGFGGVVAGPAVEGVTNGLVLIRIGYLAKERCRSFREWDAQTRRSAILASVKATQKVAVGLTAEILRRVGAGLGAVAGSLAHGVTTAAGGVTAAAGTVWSTARKWSEALNQRPAPVPPAEE